MKKYEVQVLMSHDDYVNDKLSKLYEEGWEIAGDILVKNKSGWCGDSFVYIPMKRELLDSLKTEK